MVSVGRLKLALECPTGLLEIVEPLGDFSWASIDQILIDKSYRDYYKGVDGPLFLSTRKSFTLTSVSLDEAEEALTLLGRPGLVIGPDTFGDMEDTLSLYWKWVKAIPDLVPVVQGRSINEALRCAYSYDCMVALPFDIASEPGTPLRTKMQNRLRLVETLWDRHIHLLGITSLEELYWYSSYSHVLSINTGLPVRLGLAGQSIVGYGEEKERDSRQYMDMRSKELPAKDKMDLVLDNIERLKEVLNG